MNKFLTKIATAFVGMTMAIGVGVALGANREVKVAEAAISDSDLDTVHATTITFSDIWSADHVLSTSNEQLGQTDYYVKRGGNGTNTKYFNNGKNIRVYQNNTITFSSQSKKIGRIVFTNDSGYGSPNKCDSGTYSSGTWTAADKTTSSVTFTNTSSTQWRFTKIVITPILVSSSEAKNISFEPSSLTVYAGESASFVPSLDGVGTFEKTINWQSSNTSIIATPDSSEDGETVTFIPNSVNSDTVVTLTGTVDINNGASGSIEVTVKPARTLVSIAVKTAPTKLTYFVDESFDPTDLVITCTYQAGQGTKDVAYADEPSNFSFSPSTSTSLTKSNTSVTITYGGKTCSQAITVNQYAKYAQSTTSAASKTEGVEPGTDSVTFSSDGPNKNQLTSGKKQIWTFKKYNNKTITSLVINMRRNSSEGKCDFTLTNNSTNVTSLLKKSSFARADLTSSQADYELLGTDKVIEVGETGDVVLTITSTENSVYSYYIIVEWEATNVLNNSLSLSGTPTKSFTVGDEFAYGGTATASYSLSGNTVVTDDVTFKLGDTPIAIGDTITADMLDEETTDHESFTVTVTYTDPKGKVATGSYNDVVVSYDDVETVSVDTKKTQMSKNESFDFGASISPSNACQGVTWSASSSDLIDGENNDYELNTSTGNLKVHASKGGTIRITATSKGKNDSSEYVSSYVDVTVLGDLLLTLSNYQLNGFTGKTGSLTAVAGNFSGTPTFTWNSSNPTKVSITGNGDTVTINYNEETASAVTITCTATYVDNVNSINESKSATCSVSVTESAISSLTWSISELNVIEGNQLDTLPGVFTAEWNNKDETHPTSGFSFDINGTDVSLPYTWKLSDNEKDFNVSLGNSTVTATINVIEKIDKITFVENDKWVLVEDVNDLALGDKVVFTGSASGDNPGTYAMGTYDETVNANNIRASFTMNGNTKVFTEMTIEGNLLTSNVANDMIYTVADGNYDNEHPNTFAFKDSKNKYIYAAAPSSNNLKSQDNIDVNASFSITINGGLSTIVASASSNRNYLRYNPFIDTQNNYTFTPLFSCYASTSSIQNAIKLFKKVTGTEKTVSNVNYVAQKAVLDFASLFNSTMSCVMGGATANINGNNGKWKAVSDAFDETISGLEENNLEDFKAIIQHAVATARNEETGEANTGDSLQNMLARYDYIIAKYNSAPYSYELNDFLHVDVDRSAVSYLARFNLATDGISNSGNISIMAIIVSFVGVTAVAGYFLLKRRKEN